MVWSFQSKVGASIYSNAPEVFRGGNNQQPTKPTGAACTRSRAHSFLFVYTSASQEPADNRLLARLIQARRRPIDLAGMNSAELLGSIIGRDRDRGRRLTRARRVYKYHDTFMIYAPGWVLNHPHQTTTSSSHGDGPVLALHPGAAPATPLRAGTARHVEGAAARVRLCRQRDGAGVSVRAWMRGSVDRQQQQLDRKIGIGNQIDTKPEIQPIAGVTGPFLWGSRWRRARRWCSRW